MFYLIIIWICEKKIQIASFKTHFCFKKIFYVYRHVVSLIMHESTSRRKELMRDDMNLLRYTSGLEIIHQKDYNFIIIIILMRHEGIEPKVYINNNNNIFQLIS